MINVICTVDGCERLQERRTYCGMHYARWRRHGEAEWRKPGEVRDGKRICPRCQQDVSLGDYTSGGKICRPCMATYARERRKAKRPIIQCIYCGVDFEKSHARSALCSPACKKSRARLLNGNPEPTKITCQWCGIVFQQISARARFCSTKCADAEKQKRYYADPVKRAAVLARSQEWARENGDHIRARRRAARQADPYTARERNRRQKALRRSLVVVPISAASLAAKVSYWGDRCWMCHGPASSLDHVKPISRGGLHLLSNMRPACVSCNSRKNARWYGVHDLDRFRITV